MSSQSRTRPTSTMQGPYLAQPQPQYPRQRAISLTGSPHSVRTNMAVVDGPVAPAGNYYGVFLQQPPVGFPVSNASSVAGSVGSSAGSPSKPSAGVYVIPGSNIAHPVMVVNTTPSAQPTYQAKATHAQHVPLATAQQQATTLPSAMKRERRKTMTPSTTSSEHIPAAALRSMCKFSIGAISECLKRPGNEPMGPRLRRMDEVVGNMYTILFAMSTDEDAIPFADSAEITGLFQRLQALLYRCLSSRPYNKERLAELEELFRDIVVYRDRLNASFKIREIEATISRLTFQHNVSQTSSTHIVNSLNTSTKEKKSSITATSVQALRADIEKKRAELEAMHQERVTLRAEIEKHKQKLALAKQARDNILGIKSVRFQ